MRPGTESMRLGTESMRLGTESMKRLIYRHTKRSFVRSLGLELYFKLPDADLHGCKNTPPRHAALSLLYVCYVPTTR